MAGKLKKMPDNGGKSNTRALLSKVAGSIPTVVRHIFQPARCGYKLEITPQTSFHP